MLMMLRIGDRGRHKNVRVALKWCLSIRKLHDANTLEVNTDSSHKSTITERLILDITKSHETSRCHN